MQNAIFNIINDMSQHLSVEELQELQKCLLKNLVEIRSEQATMENKDYITCFLDAKKLEGCTEQTIRYYERTLRHFEGEMNAPIRKLTADDIRSYLSYYQTLRNCSKATLDNIRRNAYEIP